MDSWNPLTTEQAAIASSYVLVTMRRIILHRGKDVNVWHRRLIRWENDFDVENRDVERFTFDANRQRRERAAGAIDR